MGICLIVGGSKCLPGWFGALMQWKLKFKWVFACVKEGVKACQDALGHLSPSKRWFDKVAQIGPKIKCPRVPGWVRGGGAQLLFGHCPNVGGDKLSLTICMGAPLMDGCIHFRSALTSPMLWFEKVPLCPPSTLGWFLCWLWFSLPGEKVRLMGAASIQRTSINPYWPSFPHIVLRLIWLSQIVTQQ